MTKTTHRTRLALGVLPIAAAAAMAIPGSALAATTAQGQAAGQGNGTLQDAGAQAGAQQVAPPHQTSILGSGTVLGQKDSNQAGAQATNNNRTQQGQLQGQLGASSGWGWRADPMSDNQPLGARGGWGEDSTAQGQLAGERNATGQDSQAAAGAQQVAPPHQTSILSRGTGLMQGDSNGAGASAGDANGTEQGQRQGQLGAS